MTATNGIGTAVRTLRTAAGLSIREACALAGIGQRYLSQVENGHVVPAPKWVAHVADVFGRRIETNAAAASAGKAA